LPKPLEQMSQVEIERKQHMGKVTTHILKYLTNRFTEEGFEWILPVIFSKSTDPLWPDPGASIEKRIETEIYGKTVRTTLSMIIHKIVACSIVYPKFFVLSPNVRIERKDRQATGWHTYEFTQLDFEMRNGEFKDVRRLIEKTINELVQNLKVEVRDSLIFLGRYDSLKVPDTPFEEYDREELESKYGKDWEAQLLKRIRAPVWIRNIPREFYDFEDFEKGRWDNYDLFLPEYGEVLSGSKREWQYDKIIKKIERDGIKKENFYLLLKMAKEGRIKPSAGAGMGVERLTSWVVGAKHIGEVQPFPKIPGIVYDL